MNHVLTRIIDWCFSDCFFIFGGTYFFTQASFARDNNNKREVPDFFSEIDRSIQSLREHSDDRFSLWVDKSYYIGDIESYRALTTAFERKGLRHNLSYHRTARSSHQRTGLTISEAKRILGISTENFEKI